MLPTITVANGEGTIYATIVDTLLHDKIRRLFDVLRGNKQSVIVGERDSVLPVMVAFQVDSVWVDIVLHDPTTTRYDNLNVLEYTPPCWGYCTENNNLFTKCAFTPFDVASALLSEQAYLSGKESWEVHTSPTLTLTITPLHVPDGSEPVFLQVKSPNYNSQQHILRLTGDNAKARVIETDLLATRDPDDAVVLAPLFAGGIETDIYTTLYNQGRYRSANFPLVFFQEEAFRKKYEPLTAEDTVAMVRELYRNYPNTKYHYPLAIRVRAS